MSNETGLIAGRGIQNARAALAATEEAGFDSGLVRTSDEGYIVPVEAIAVYDGWVADGKIDAIVAATPGIDTGVELGSLHDGSAGEPEQVDLESLKRAELDEIAADRGIDVSGAKNKGEVIALLNAPVEADQGDGDADADPAKEE